jgi:hypothetical protein
VRPDQAWLVRPQDAPVRAPDLHAHDRIAQRDALQRASDPCNGAWIARVQAWGQRGLGDSAPCQPREALRVADRLVAGLGAQHGYCDDAQQYDGRQRRQRELRH